MIGQPFRVTHRLSLCLALASAFAPSSDLACQSGGFVITLGIDTMQLERFEWRGNVLAGVIAARSPSSRLVRYELTLDNSGRVQRFEMRATDGEGRSLPRPPRHGTFEYLVDTIVRTTDRDSGGPLVQRIPAPTSVFPGPWLPYTGMTFLAYELAFRDARSRSADNETSIALLTMLPGSLTAQRIKAWFVSADSAELDYFGRARSGWKFSSDGRLLRADWTGTTYGYRATRVEQPPDVESVAMRWAAAERAGTTIGAMSPRDSSLGRVGPVNVTVTYSRPAQRGRVVWGGVVPWGQVWRLGADMATHVTFSGDVRVGGARVPAGTYTLWMLPHSPGTAELIVNRQTRIFGTAYNATHDLMRVPMTARKRSMATERLTIRLEPEALVVEWGTLAWTVPVVQERGW